MPTRKNKNQIGNKRYYQVREVVTITGVNDSTLRNWETRYPELKGIKRINGRRHYTDSDIDVIRKISYLRNRIDVEDVDAPQAASKATQRRQNQTSTVQESEKTESQLSVSVRELKRASTELRELKGLLQELIKQLS